MTHLAFFGHDANDAAIRRRVKAFSDDGIEVTGFMARRAEAADTPWRNIDLGRTYDGAYVQRVRSIYKGAAVVAQHADALKRADLIYARNLDMLACAFLAKRKLKLDTPVIYECLDVHRLLSRSDLIGQVFRQIERALLKRTRRLVVSSPGFLENHFEKYHAGMYTPVMIENRLAAGADYGPRPDPGPPVNSTAPLRIGWVGILRCARSLDLLLGVARQFGDRVRLELHGAPALREVPDFHQKIAGLPNVAYHGRYRSPDDLSRIYAGIDVVWAGDYMEAGANSVWLLPNRLYEGGYYGVPPIAPAATQTSSWILDHASGWSIREPVEESLPRLLQDLIAHRAPIDEFSRSLLQLAPETFVQPHGFLADLIKSAADNHLPHRPDRVSNSDSAGAHLANEHGTRP